ncbi:MAG TPA: hypothetical protein EYQ74_05300 [Planctomycetes bacterium]|nr:hypothetical protein [Planctomycetota bacterium]HIK61901.1 hypothetical protein [Planctomycetota bacterium]
MSSEARRRLRTTRLSALLALCLMSGLMLTPQGRTQAVRWIPDGTEGPAWFHGKLSEAQVEAKERNVPLVVCCVLEGEEASGRLQEALSEDKSFASLTEGVILLLANNGDHEQKEIRIKDADGKRIKKSVCSAFGTDDCDAHKLHWDTVYRDYVMPDGGEWLLPDIYLIRPNGKLERRFLKGSYGDSGGAPSISTVAREVEVFQKILGPGVRTEDLADLRRETTMAQAMSRAKLWADSWRSWANVSGLAPGGPHAEAAKSGMELAVKEMKLSLEIQAKRMVPETLEDAYRRIRAMDFDDSPIEREVGKVLGAARRNPKLKPRLTEIDLILEAEELLEDIEEALRAKNKGLAKRLLRKLASKKLGQTPAAELAKDRYKDL